MLRTAAHTYWPEIDGIRAVAVSLVILHHLRAALVPGGFIGVDMFFIISGLVVTTSILNAEGESIWRDLLAFWRRRILRILPALLVMVLVTTLVFGAFYAPTPMEPYNGTLRTGIAAIFGVGNIYLYRLAQDYFQSDSTINLFVHTWSLGVEEQFYVLYALVFLVGLRLIFGGARLLWARAALLAVLSLASLVLFLWSHDSHPMWIYFMLAARFWELASGALLALAYSRWCSDRGPAVKGDAPPLSQLQSGGLQFAAVALLAFAIVLPTWQPKAFAAPIMIGVVATNLLVVSLLFGRSPLAAILTAKPALLMGLWSYSLYLWHWPVLTVVRDTVGISWMTGVPCLGLIGVIAWLSYRFVELPCRSWRSASTVQLIAALAAAVAVAAVPSALLQRAPGLFFAGRAQDWAGDWRPAEGYAYGGSGHLIGRDCSLRVGSRIPDAVPEACTLAGSGGLPRRRLLLLGDSHAFSDWNMVIEATRALGVELLVLGHDGCSPLNRGEDGSCGAYLRQAPALIRRHLRAGDTAMVVHFWPVRDYAAMNIHLEAIVAQAAGLGASVVVEAPMPSFERPSYLCVPEWFRMETSGCSQSRAALEARSQGPLRLLANLADRHPGTLHVWRPVDILCDASQCLPFRQGKPLFRDTNHMSVYGARFLAPAFRHWLVAQAVFRPG